MYHHAHQNRDTNTRRQRSAGKERNAALASMWPYYELPSGDQAHPAQPCRRRRYSLTPHQRGAERSRSSTAAAWHAPVASSRRQDGANLQGGLDLAVGPRQPRHEGLEVGLLDGGAAPARWGEVAVRGAAPRGVHGCAGMRHGGSVERAHGKTGNAERPPCTQEEGRRSHVGVAGSSRQRGRARCGSPGARCGRRRCRGRRPRPRAARPSSCNRRRRGPRRSGRPTCSSAPA